MSHINFLITIAEHRRLVSPAKSIGCYLVRHADDSGIVTTDAEGRPISPVVLAEALGEPVSTIRRALAQLDALGLVVWRRPSPQVRGKGTPGTIRIVLPSSGQ
jgi:hypothetical protein